MPRLKRSSPTIDKATGRADALCTIDVKLDLGKGLTVAAYKGKIQAAADQLTEYNNLLSQADAAGAILDTLETDLADLTERMLKGVATHYGRSSAEYGQAGGTRKSDIKSPARKPAADKIKKLAA